MIRLNKHIAALGICSRRKADEFIVAGKVNINGTIVTDLGTKVDPEKDIVTVENVSHEPRTLNSELFYIALNKPVDIISSASSEQGTSVLDLITKEQYYKPKFEDDVSQLDGVRIYPVGRLDKDSEGLILLTNDGELTNELTHPRYEHEKEYEVTIDKKLMPDTKKLLSKGMLIEGEHYGGMQIVKEWNQGKRVILTVILKEGKNRHIRKMLGQLGYNVSVLRRVRIGKLKLGTLTIGRWKFVERSDIV
ncbi:MAG: rRNA pseudouridine synthase [Candidatus Magasanikbacteria bacterium CG_4_9_14_0_2_um_filter_42_11]|uniref:Pseudouridine synthase n=1 Tax=Candidatus Magasanikbacteria bacterium CG_4_9_14_0_2_um_filter_42_11 TaxID=1974643 RepID=A0A2M8F894_9BACT|nr:MAG: rRNA pseudouridine synthase [Candidatus Magasanikbacteria bacterium CG10_big_fil_rev_8_21_14_0_10_43_9]PIY92899.1 MAG: rRNA pseudouridine synthase [Candidatus Magasanikbacteria bacterium CG_4_10_14_0_8_um_filter_42_12]PJC51952.1 MAG: rRNA pseudouridine synthase [Candidatus Magasanikbacteria bacterium CG_4_9_14_0_2_um_filter_42_11]